MTVRMLPDAEWEKARPIYEAHGDKLPELGSGQIIVAEADGQIIGLWGVNMVLHAGPLWVAPEFRRMGVADEMGKAVDAMAQGLGAKGYLMFPSNRGAVAVAERMHLTPTEWVVYRRDF